MSTSQSTSVPSDFKPMGVDDVTFLVDRLGEDCAPLQFVRELTQNAITAVLLRSDHQGHVTWDVDWTRYELADSPTYKLAIIDNGVGMTGEEMVRYINNLSSFDPPSVEGGQLRRGRQDRGSPPQSRRPSVPQLEGQQGVHDPPLSRSEARSVWSQEVLPSW